MVPELVLLFVALWFILWGDLFYVLPCVILFLCISVLRANLSAFCTFVWFVIVWFCLFPFPLGVWEWLRFVIVALLGLFSYLLFCVLLLNQTFVQHLHQDSLVINMDIFYDSVWHIHHQGVHMVEPFKYSSTCKVGMLYCIYPKYLDTSTPYHICSKIWTSTIHYPMLCLKIAGRVANSVDPDETPRSAASHLGLYCLLRPVCPNIYGKYGRRHKTAVNWN